SCCSAETAACALHTWQERPHPTWHPVPHCSRVWGEERRSASERDRRSFSGSKLYLGGAFVLAKRGRAATLPRHVEGQTAASQGQEPRQIQGGLRGDREDDLEGR